MTFIWYATRYIRAHRPGSEINPLPYSVPTGGLRRLDSLLDWNLPKTGWPESTTQDHRIRNSLIAYGQVDIGNYLTSGVACARRRETRGRQSETIGKSLCNLNRNAPQVPASREPRQHIQTVCTLAKKQTWVLRSKVSKSPNSLVQKDLTSLADDQHIKVGLNTSLLHLSKPY